MLSGDHWLFYPDIQASGGLAPALEAEFAHLRVALNVRGFGEGAWARVEANKRFCQISLGAVERIIMPDFWANGVVMGSLLTTDLHLCAGAVAYWIDKAANLTAMKARFSGFQTTEKAEAFEQGHGIDYTWAEKLDWTARDLPRLIPLIEAAMRRPQLRQLMPFTSHESLHFSRSIGYPYTNDIAHAIPLGENSYRALGPDYQVHKEIYTYGILGEGSAEHVIDLIVAALPVNCGPAIIGTARDLVFEV